METIDLSPGNYLIGRARAATWHPRKCAERANEDSTPFSCRQLDLRIRAILGFADGSVMSARVERSLVKAEHRDGEIEFPVAVLSGVRDGPTLAVIAGMHGGEYTGPVAAMQLIRECGTADLA